MNQPKDIPILILIAGESGSGKTTLSLALQEHYNIPCVCSYTTRPMRPSETEGVEHKFVKEFSKTDDDEILAYTVYGDYQYWTLLSQLRNGLNTYVIDRPGIDWMRERFGKSGKFHILTVLITRNNKNESVDADRINRDFKNPLGKPEDYDIVIENDGSSIQEFTDLTASLLEPKVRELRKFTNE